MKHFLIVEALDLGTTIVEQQDIIVRMTLLAHHSGTYLAQAHTMAPALAFKHKLIAIFLNIKG